MSPHAPPLHGSLPPQGADLPWGGPAAGRVNATVETLEVVVNGAPQTTTATTLHDWVLAQGVSPEAVANALHGPFVPPRQRAQQPLVEGDTILTFQPIVGG